MKLSSSSSLCLVFFCISIGECGWVLLTFVFCLSLCAGADNLAIRMGDFLKYLLMSISLWTSPEECHIKLG